MTAARTPRLLQIAQDDPDAIRADLLAGLLEPVARVAPKYLYDALGSRLFAAITELPEYYLTRTEAAIFNQELGALAAALGPVDTLVDLGAGNCEKAERLFDALGVRRYLAVDISVAYLRESLDNLQHRHPHLDVLGLGLDFSSRLELPDLLGDGPRTLFYPGSSIGNFTPAEALTFLRQAHSACQGGALLIGVDQVKPTQILESAYDDPLGVTAAFNRNLLPRLNRLAGTDFQVQDWRHLALFNPDHSRIEMHLEAARYAQVTWPGGGLAFAAGARIHTENSYKWRAGDFAQLLEQAGFVRPRRWSDPQNWFALFLAFA
jgi:dimethylhistidine N-methyltransferase